MPAVFIPQYSDYTPFQLLQDQYTLTAVGIKPMQVINLRGSIIRDRRIDDNTGTWWIRTEKYQSLVISISSLRSGHTSTLKLLKGGKRVSRADSVTSLSQHVHSFLTFVKASYRPTREDIVKLVCDHSTVANKG